MRSRLLFAQAFVFIFALATLSADPPVVKKSRVSLSKFDVSSEILQDERPAAERKLLPRRNPGYHELHQAVWTGNQNATAALLSVGADPNAKSKDGEPILHYAVWCGYEEPLEDLLRAGADPNLVNQHGDPPLSKAAYSGNAKVVALLMAYGADPNQKSRSGTVLEHARTYANKNVLALLEVKPEKLRPVTRFTPPKVLRQPTAIFGAANFTAPGGGQAVAYSPDSRLLISGDEGGAIRMFDAASGALYSVFRGHDRAVLALACIPDSRILVSAGADNIVRFWDLDTLHELKRLRNHWGQGKALAVSPDGKALCTGDHVWQIESVAPLKLADAGQELRGMHALWCFFTPDNQYLVIHGNDQGIRIWHAEKNRLHKLDLKAATVKSVRWKDIAAVVEIGDADPNDLLLLLVDQYSVLSGTPAQLKSVETPVGALDNHTRALAASPNGKYLASFGYNSRIQVRDLERGEWFQHDGHQAAVQAVAISPEGSLIASGGDDKQVRLWKRSTREQIAVIPTDNFVYSVCFSPDGVTLAIGDNGGKVYLCDRKGRSIGSYQPGGRVTGLAFDERGRFLASVGGDLHLYDVTKRTEVAKIYADSSQQGKIAVSPDGRWIIGTANSMSAGETFKVPNAWAIDGAILTSVHFDLFGAAMGHRSFVEAVAFSPDASLVAASSQSAIRLWDFKKKQPVGLKMSGHTYGINDLKFSPDGRWLASASWDGTARIWDVATGGQIAILDVDVYRISSIDFTTEGDLVTANWDGTVHLWELSRLLDR